MRICQLILCLLFFLEVKAQEPFVQDIWLNESNSAVKINAVVTDPKGYQWVATDDGVYSYNGRRFVAIHDNIQKPATALVFVRETLYIGYADGSVGRLHKNDTIARVIIQNKAPTAAITSMHAFGGVLWVCTEGQGIFTIVNTIGISLNTGNGLSDDFVYTLAKVADGCILAGTDKGINEISLHDGRTVIKNYTTAHGLPDNIVRVIKHIPGTPIYWCGTQQSGLSLFNGSDHSVAELKQDELWRWGQVNDILPMDAWRAWVATEDGFLLEVMRNEKNELKVKEYRLAGKRIEKLTISRSGVIRAATNAGITMISAEYMRYIAVKQDFSLGEILAMTCDKKNTLWFAAGERLFNLPLDSNEINPLFVAKLPANITCLYADKENRIWIGTFGKGMWYRDVSGALIEVKDIPPLVNESILDITGTSGRLWVAGLNGVQEIFYPGLYTKKMDLLKLHNKHSGIGSDYIYQLYADRKDRIWMATDGAGVCMYNEGRYVRWDSASGMTSKVVYSVTEDAYGNIWAATLSNGLYSYNGSQWFAMKGLGVQDVNISTIAANATGQVIVVNAKGIDVWYPRSGLFRNYPRRTFDIDSSSTVLKLSAKDTSGNVYIPFEDGFIVFKNIRDQYDIRPAVNIQSASVFFTPVDPGVSRFSYDQNHLSFRFEGVNFANPDRLHYRYKLEGYNETWVITNDESVTFPQLPDGSYTFRVQASLNNMFNKASEATYSFTVEKPVWKRAWFIILAAFGLSAIAVAYVRSRERNLRKLASLQRERMMFEYEHLKSQVNPHFLFNSLNTLTSLIEDDKNAAVDYTTRLSDLYRNTLSYRNKDLITIAEEWEILDNYIYIQQSRFGDALRVRYDVSEEIKNTKKVVPLALQLLVENAIKHNVVSSSKPLDIHIAATADTISVQNTFQPKMSKEKGAGLGLVNIKKRYALLSKKQISFGIHNNQYIVTLPLL